jgi:hypothetical protein
LGAKTIQILWGDKEAGGVNDSGPARRPIIQGTTAYGALSGSSFPTSAASGFARGCAKTRKSQRGAELFSLLPSSEGGRQRYSFLD